MGKRGPQSLGNSAELNIGISPALDGALNQLVAVSGVSKAAIVRDVLTRHLSSHGVMPPSAVLTTTPTLTRRPTTATERN
ncbi:ribbon-helix-helix domain-containing protein [Leifsonia aquatica]|uniref:ribbon-helix-helix domain-containing protein n=1 Tax=Leifsonia aquatica TaxID=144185 RepID=UPI0038222046